MAFIVNRPGLTLIVVGVFAFLLRNLFRWVPLVGGLTSAVLGFVGVFFVVGGTWLAVIGRKRSDA